MKRKISVLLLFVLIGIFAFPVVANAEERGYFDNSKYRWPVNGDDTYIVTEIDENGFTIMAPDDSRGEVYPIEDGVIWQIIKENQTDIAKTFGVEGYGNVAIVQHTNKRFSLYGHLASLDKATPGKEVTQTSCIGEMGRSGTAKRRSLRLELFDFYVPKYANHQDLMKEYFIFKKQHRIQFKKSLKNKLKNDSFYTELFNDYFNSLDESGKYYVKTKDITVGSNLFQQYYIATSFGEGNIYIIIGIAVSLVIVSISIIVFTKKKKRKNIKI